MTKTDSEFKGSIPELYDQYMVPMLFEPYAVDLAARAAQRGATRILELAAGTGVVSRRLAATFGAEVEIVATDLNQAMLDRAAANGTCRPVHWQISDAMCLPFGDAEFDLVVCQFGVMFFPDKAEAFAEARRVLRPGGFLLFNVWDRIEDNEFTHVVAQALATLWPDDPPRFMERTPHGYYDVAAIRRDLRKSGFATQPHIDAVSKRSIAALPLHPAIAFCQGTPLRAEIEARGDVTLAEATLAAEDALRTRFGGGPIEGQIRAHVAVAQR